MSPRSPALAAVAALALGCREPAPRPPAPAPPPPALAADTAAALDALLADTRRRLEVPGLAFVLVLHERVAYARALGRRDADPGLSLTLDTRVPIGACTKAFTAMAVAISQDQGRLRLDDSPRPYLPGFHMADPEADAVVTLRDLLSNQTGLMARANLAAAPGVLSRAEYVRAAISAAPVAPPRSEYHDSDATFVAAGMIAGRVRGTRWEQVIESDIFSPLGMRSSAAGGKALAPAQGIVSSARDMARWLLLLAGGGRIDGRRLLSASGFRELTCPAIAVDEMRSAALGWMVERWDGLEVLSSTGARCRVSVVPARGAGFVLLTGASGAAQPRVGERVWPLLLGLAPPPAPPSPAPPPSAARPPPAPLPELAPLLERMIAAAGGAAALARHTSFELRAHKSYDNQGVDAALTIRGRAPARRSHEERWMAAGRPIGQVRLYFDGTRGGRETSFGRGATNDDVANARARRDFDLHPLLHLRELYRRVRVTGRARRGGIEAIVLELAPRCGPIVQLGVAAATGLVAWRRTPESTISYGDYRAVDGELLPFRRTIEDALGTTTVVVDDVRFNVVLPDEAFEPAGAGSVAAERP